jgi:hypothetical protein
VQVFFLAKPLSLLSILHHLSYTVFVFLHHTEVCACACVRACVSARSDLKRVPVPAHRLSSCTICTDEETVHNKLENLRTGFHETQYYRILQKRVEPFETGLNSDKNNALVTCKRLCRLHPVKLITYLPQPPPPPPKN